MLAAFRRSNFKTILGISCLGLLSALAAFAMEPPRPGELECYRADGSLQARRAFAQNVGNHRASPVRVAEMQRRLLTLQGASTEAVPAPPPDWRGMPTKGAVKLFALLIDFQDTPHSNGQDVIDSRLFGDGHPALYPYESLRNYYLRSSFGQLEIGGSTLGWYTAPYPRASVPQTTAGREGLIREALDTFEAQGHDFSQYDNDGDGVIDYFLVIWTGSDNGWANFWWGYQTSYYDSSYTLDGKTLGAYSWQWEANPYPGGFTPRVTIHETGHALGVPDYYDYDDGVGPRGGVGGLDQMDANRYDHNSFSKFMLDWITPVVCRDPGQHRAVLRSAALAGDAVIAMPEATPSSAYGEFFMVQYRDREDNDKFLPTDGLVIWHVDSRLDQYGWNFLYDNSYTDHKLLRLMEADGLEEIEQNRSANSGDFYKAEDAFGPATMPSSDRYDGTHSEVQVTGIVTEETGGMGFDLNCSGASPCGGARPVITGVKFVSSTKRLKVTGTGFRNGMEVWLFGQELKTTFKNSTLLKGKIQSITRGVPVEVRAIDTATGCASDPFIYIR